MAALVPCGACQMGDHDNHDGSHHGLPGVLGGHQCACPGGCEAPDPSEFFGILTDEEQMALVTAVRVQQVARIITRDTGASEDAATTAAWSLASIGLLATPWRGDVVNSPGQQNGPSS